MAGEVGGVMEAKVAEVMVAVAVVVAILKEDLKA